MRPNGFGPVDWAIGFHRVILTGSGDRRVSIVMAAPRRGMVRRKRREQYQV
jgi:hypothetical protein